MTLFGKSAFAGLLALGATLALPALAQDALRVGQTFLVDNLDPTAGSAGWALTSHGVGGQLWSVDAAGRLVPELAQSANRTGDLSWTITLAEGRRFSDGSPVTAAALKAGFENTFAKNAPAAATGGKLSFEAPDDRTLLVTTERPVAMLPALFAEWPLIAYGFDGAGQPLFTGPYKVTGFTADATLDLAANPYHPAGADRSDITLRKFGDAQTMALALQSGELDLAFGLPVEGLSAIRANPDLTVKSFQVGYQYFGFLNTESPTLSDPKLRQAIDLALGRPELIEAIGNGVPATGAFAPYFPFAGKVERVSDRYLAGDLLDKAGWTAGSDGKRTKDGVPLRLRLVTYSSRPDLVTMLPVVAAQLNRLGIASETRVVENPGDAAAEGDFDIFLWAQHTAPNGDPAFFFNSMLVSGAALNHARYKSPAFDAIIAKFSETADPETRNQIALEAQDQLFEDVPVTFLIAPEWRVGLSTRLKDYEPWGSDYYVIRPEMGEIR
ncbi:ABC transporter substrate-binding protein [Paracoccus aminophilus]|uniref:ABC-type dipeptide/oligopeptide/nickel transport systems, substrate binding component n=1 Tax=Paracoccus aminophilus JCM 7686 TaxID=1367847 RepID=S5YGN7_PARAH|nr:ABC transporter substrate-binding protein [Paracoccus aminophilus]AGT10623.1 ABC-type dipeptide/oligopeptide/nickel transport systems, substrate binding component [Paracoccus aminophilus JCM 7686]